MSKIRTPSDIEFNWVWKQFFGKLFNIQDWNDVTLEGAWADAGNDPQYYKDPWGRVHLKGVIDTGTGGTTAFTLPEGFRPSGTIGFSCHGSLVTITSAGVVTPASTATVYLDQISFRTG